MHEVVIFDKVSECFRRRPYSSLRDIFGRGEIIWALKDISFVVYKGEMFGIIGPNGAGKTTILKLIAGILKPDKGRVIVKGKVSNLIEIGVGFHEDLSVYENIFLSGTILGMSQREIKNKIDSIIDFSGLRQFLDMPVKFLSTGMFVRLGFSVAVHTDFDVLVVDEVLVVGDEEFQEKCFQKIEEIKKQNKTIIFASHNLNLIKKYCDRVMLIKDGYLKKIGSPAEVIEFYKRFL